MPRARTVSRVLQALIEAGRPLTIGELAKRSHLSYPTVRDALRSAGAGRLDNDYPARFLPPANVALPIGPFSKSEADLIVPMTAKPIAPRWNESVEQIGTEIRDLHITPLSNIGDVYRQVVAGASILASMAHEIEGVLDSPDWYAQLEIKDEA